jgi:hypothetical protein
MSRKEYKETLKKAQNGEEIDLKDKSVFQSKKGDVSRADEKLTQNDAFYDSSLEIGSDKMETKKDSLIGKIFFKTYKIKKMLGEGSFGQIYVAFDINTKEEYAVKLVCKIII